MRPFRAGSHIMTDPISLVSVQKVECFSHNFGDAFLTLVCTLVCSAEMIWSQQSWARCSFFEYFPTSLISFQFLWEKKKMRHTKSGGNVSSWTFFCLLYNSMQVEQKTGEHICEEFLEKTEQPHKLLVKWNSSWDNLPCCAMSGCSLKPADGWNIRGLTWCGQGVAGSHASCRHCYCWS